MKKMNPFKYIEQPVLLSFVSIVLLLLIGSLYLPNFLSATYLLQLLQLSAFLGIIASGAMLIILLGHIDLSVPWVLTASAMMATAVAGWGGFGADVAILVGVGVGLLFGIFNGIGVAYLRIPSMIFTLGVNAVAQGLMVVYTGGAAPQDDATNAMRILGSGKLFDLIPNMLIVWIVLGLCIVLMLRKTAMGRYVYAFGNSEAASYLSGINTRFVVIVCFAIAGACSGLAGVLLAGYGAKAAQGMGDAYLLPAIAAVVLGGTHILGGRGSYLGTVAGVILITLLQSILQTVQLPPTLKQIFEAPESLRQIVYGLVIIVMMLLYGREKKLRS